MKISARYYGIFAQVAGCREEQVDLPGDLCLPRPSTILDALEVIGRHHPALAEALFLASGEPAPYARPFLNGVPASGEALSRPLREGDEISLVPALSGGAAPTPTRRSRKLCRGALRLRDTIPSRDLVSRAALLRPGRFQRGRKTPLATTCIAQGL